MRIAVVGLGAVGEACAHALTASEVARSLVLLNRTEGVAPAIAADLRQARAWGRPLDTEVGSPTDWQKLKGCELIVLTLGARLKGDQDRSEMAKSTAAVIRGNEQRPGFLQSLKTLLADDPDATPIVVVVSNPVEATVTWLLQETAWPRARMLGLGTTVESARFSGFLAEELNVDAGSVWMDIIGEHGKRFEPLDDSRLRKMFPEKKIEAALKFAERETRDAARSIRELSEGLGKQKAGKFAAKLRAAMKDQVDPSALDHVAAAVEDELQWSLAPPATRYAIAASANMVAKAIREDLNQVLTVSALPPAELCKPNVALALPFVVGKEGVGPCLLETVPSIIGEVATAVQDQVSSMSAEGSPSAAR